MVTTKHIKTLEDSVINKIAAGEVVERPASVVKELVENSLDAKSTQIEIQLIDGGKKSIIIRDNGIGILPEELKLAVARHSTSKLSQAEDLFSLNTMGFRGEALASIASISKFSIISKHDDHEAQELVIEGGNLISESSTGHPQGTTVSVKYLFFQTPARLKFLKTKETELSHITDYITKVALAHPHVGFTLLHQGKKIIKVNKESSVEQRIKDLFGEDILEHSYNFFYEHEGLTVHGYAGHPQIGKAHARYMYLFVNGRPIKDKTIFHAVVESYRDLLMKGRYPFVVLYLEIPPEMVDVNVHPAKTEVRFSASGVIHRAVYEAIRTKLVESPWQQNQDNQSPQKNDDNFRRDESSYSSHYSFTSRNSDQGRDHSKEFSSNNDLFTQTKKLWDQTETTLSSDQFRSNDFKKQSQIGKVPYKDMQVIGQLLGTYIICQSEHKLILVDQHAAHERVRFEKLLLQYEENKLSTQPLLIPENFDLISSETEILKKYTQDFEKFGFEIEFFGGNTFVLKSMPHLFEGKLKIKPFIQDVIGDLLEQGKLTSLKDKFHHILATMACHSAIRAHHLLNREQMIALMEELDQYQLTSFCPHGRPVYVEVSEYELEKWFKRIVS